jgi:hypothetical protein
MVCRVSQSIHPGQSPGWHRFQRGVYFGRSPWTIPPPRQYVMPRPANNSAEQKRRARGKSGRALRDELLSEISPEQIVQKIKAKLNSESTFESNKALQEALSLLRNSDIDDVDAASLEDEEIEDELFAYLPRILIELPDDVFDRVLADVEAGRRKRKADEEKLRRFHEQEAATPFDPSSFIQPSPIA